MTEIQKLNKQNLQKACITADKAFFYKTMPPSTGLNACMNRRLMIQFKEVLDKDMDIQLETLQYWVAFDTESKEAMGIIGLYTTVQDREEANWISWFCVGEEFRNRGVGNQLLQFVIEETRKKRKKYLRFMTSTDPHEADAQRLYEKNHFIIREDFGRKKSGSYEIFYRQLIL